MKTNPDRSLKSVNMKWLVMLAVLDLFLVLFFVAPEIVKDATLNQLAVMRGLTTSVVPVVVLLLAGMLSHDMKATLVYWKLTNALPGCQAFSRYGPGDSRIDMVALKKNVGELPTDPVEQNRKWFKLYKMVGSDPVVVEAHRMYLLYRDMAAMSLPLVALAPAGMYFVGASIPTRWTVAAIFAAQFLMCVAAARNSGRRFVCNVLSIHSTKKVTNSKPAAAA